MNDERQKHDDAPLEAEAAREATAATPTPQQEIERLEDQCGQLEAKLQRALADLQNIRRRQRQEIDDNRQRVLEALTQELLPVLDTFTMALQAYDSQAESADPKALIDGVRMVRTMLAGVLEQRGLQEIAGTGPFDPNRHEAMAVEPSDDVPEGHIVRALLAGYQLGDKVVRHSRVVVSGGPQDAGAAVTEQPKNDTDETED